MLPALEIILLDIRFHIYICACKYDSSHRHLHAYVGLMLIRLNLYLRPECKH